MSDSTQKTYLRDSHGPRAVGRGENRRQRDAGEESKSSRPKHSSSRRPSRSETSHRRKSSSAGSSVPERPSFELDVIEQPQKNIVFGSTVETTAIVSLKTTSPEMVAAYRGLDTSRLMAMVTLVADTRSGERVPVECGTLTGQKMFDSVHPMPDHIAESLARSQPCRLSLGYFTFPSLLIRQPGTYRLRVTLIKMSSSGSSTSGGTSVHAVDSDTVKVERRNPGNGGTPRKHQRG